MDCSLPSSSVHEILQARILEWVAISLSGNLPNPGIEHGSPVLQGDSLPSEPSGKPDHWYKLKKKKKFKLLLIYPDLFYKAKIFNGFPHGKGRCHAAHTKDTVLTLTAK